MNITIQHITALLATELQAKLSKIKEEYATKRMNLYRFQTAYCHLVTEHKDVLDEKKRIAEGMKTLFKGRIGKFDLVPRMSYYSDTLPAVPYEVFEDRKGSKPIRSKLTIDIRFEDGKTIECHVSILIPFTGDVRQLCEAWRDERKAAVDADAKVRRIEAKVSNIANEAHILHLKLTDPEAHLAVSEVIKEYISNI